MVSISDFPSEVLEKITVHLRRNDQLVLRMTSRRLNHFVQSRMADLHLPEKCEIPTLKIYQLPNAIKISTIVDRAMALHFVPAQKHEIRSKKRKENNDGKIECFVDFPFPLPQKLSLFENAKIGQVEMHKKLPVRVDEANLKQLSTLLHGCSIEKFTLVLDEVSISNLHMVPSFLTQCQVKHVEFTLLSKQEDLMPYFLCGKFSECLAKSGVRSVTFSGMNYPTPVNYSRTSVFEVLLVLFNAGITSISVLPDTRLAFVGITLEEFKTLILNLSMLSRRLTLKLKLGQSIDGLNDGRRGFNGGFVEVSNSRSHYGQSIIVEVTRNLKRKMSKEA